ncbi:FAD-dependent oxidoreductase [bacterium]|nr:FAD-dependent oxidoreductase [bacterium]
MAVTADGQRLSRRGFLAMAAAGVACTAGAGVAGAAEKSAAADAAGGAAPAGTAPAGTAPAGTTSSTSAAADAGAATSQVRTIFRSNPDWLGEAPAMPETFVDEQTADIVVVGCGHSGAACARKAAELGKSVIVIEQQSNDDTFMVLGQAMGHINSKWQADQGVPTYDVAEFVHNWQLHCANRAQGRLVHDFAVNGGQAIDDLIAVCPADAQPMAQAWPAPEGWQHKIGDFCSYPAAASFGPNINAAMAAQRQAIVDAGGQVIYDMSAYRLIGDATSGVTGVVGKDADGAFHKYVATQAVVLAAGDFSGDKAMFADLCQEVAETNVAQEQLAGQGWSGQGQKMGLWAGAAMEIGPRAAMGGNFGLPMSGMVGTPVLRVNKYGKRFGDEFFAGGVTAGISGARQPSGLIYDVWDANFAAYMSKNPLEHFNPEATADGIAQIQEQMDQALAAGADGLEVHVQRGPAYTGPDTPAYLYGADTIEQLAEYMGLDEEAQRTFVEEVERYNELCAKGEDEDFGKDPTFMIALDNPPYFAYGNTPNTNDIMCALAGLFVTGEQQVVAADTFEPIRGLYATGNCAGGRFPLQYTAPMNGASIGFALAGGYSLGLYLGNR